MLSGFGKSPSATIKDTGAFIFHLIGELKLSKPVFICASMSGRYALPSVLKPKSGTCENNFRGFIPIAPVGTSSYTSEDYVQCKVWHVSVCRVDITVLVCVLRLVVNSRVTGQG